MNSGDDAAGAAAHDCCNDSAGEVHDGYFCGSADSHNDIDGHITVSIASRDATEHLEFWFRHRSTCKDSCLLIFLLLEARTDLAVSSLRSRTMMAIIITHGLLPPYLPRQI